MVKLIVRGRAVAVVAIAAAVLAFPMGGVGAQANFHVCCPPDVIPSDEPELSNFQGDVTAATCYGTYEYVPKDASLDLLTDLLESQGVAPQGLAGLLPSGNDGQEAFPVVVVIAVVAIFLLSSSLEPPAPPPDMDDVWQYSCTVTGAWLRVTGSGSVARRVSLEQHDAMAKEYKEIGTPCEYDGVVDPSCPAFFGVTESDPYEGGVKSGINDRPMKGCVGYAELVRAVNAPQHWALEDFVPTVRDPDPDLGCKEDVAIEWCNAGEQDCDPVANLLFPDS